MQVSQISNKTLLKIPDDTAARVTDLIITDNSLAVLSVDNGDLWIFDLKLKSDASKLGYHEKPVWVMASQESILASGSQDTTIKLWDTQMR